MPVIINTQKSSDKSFVDFGDIIKYTITIVNSGDTPISNVYLIDTLPTEVTFTTNSVFINGTQFTGFKPTIPITIPDISPSNAVTVSFECGVNTTFPLPSTISNLGNLLYSYTLTSNNFRQSDISTQSTVSLNKAILGVTKYTEDFSGLNYPLPTTIVINNFGNTVATDLVLSEILDSGMHIDLTSIKEDNISIIGDPILGISLGDLNVNSTKTISYTMFVDSLPSSNFVETFNNLAYAYKIDPLTTIKSTALTGSYYELSTISSAVLSPTYSVTPSISFVGLTVTYTLSINNIGNLPSQFTTFSTTLPSEVSFVLGSVYINNINYPLYNPLTPISLPNLNPLDITTISFIASIDTLPNTNPIINTALINYKSALPNTTTLNDLNTISNVASLAIGSNNILFNKSTDKYFYTIGDTITYTISISNQGSVDLINSVLYDTLPTNLSFIANSVKINGISDSSSPIIGIPLNTIPINSTSTITFNAKIIS
ncbi:MAG: DUF11 domain-containing protein [Clostridium sp.]